MADRGNSNKMAKSKFDAQGKKLKKKVNRDVAKVLNKNSKVKENLLGMNPYLESLLDPFNSVGAKIPDMNMQPSSTFQVVDRQTLTASSTAGSIGVCGISYGVGGQTSATAYGSLIPIPNIGATFSVGCILGASATTTDLFPAVGGATSIQLVNWTAATDQIPKTYNKVRLVSAACQVEALGTPLNAKGKVTVAFASRNTIRQEIPSGNVGVSRIAALPGAKQVPLNKLEGATVRYNPQDSMSLIYVDMDIQPASSWSAVDWTSNVNCVGALGGELFLIIDGATAADSFVVTTVLNYEATPRVNTQNIVAATPSDSDPLALSHAFNSIQMAPTTIPRAVQNITSAMSRFVSHPPEKHRKPKILDSIMSGLKTGVGIAKEVAPLAKELFALL